MGDLKDIHNNSTIGVANNDEINFYLGYVPELANIIWSYTTEADPNGEYEFDNGTLTVTTAPAASKEDSLTITAKNGTDTIDQYKIKLQAK